MIDSIALHNMNLSIQADKDAACEPSIVDDTLHKLVSETRYLREQNSYNPCTANRLALQFAEQRKQDYLREKKPR